ncbi:uncharacterized protein G2W53_015090 [Senna tora]|uniref:Uncharacterized protein n=1 Tax=Senna tora TaxID=362788 RepID=A0A835C975_9FABA|nr:uncharacterized protein G2W53_015090 [Senna tora]
MPKQFCVFSSKIYCNKRTAPRDLMQRDDGNERSVRWPWILLRCARQEPVENPKQSRARDFLHLPPNQTLPLPRRRRLLLLHSPEALLRFLQQDLLQRDNGTERSVRWPWILLRCARQEPVQNPKQSRARDFPHLPPNQTLPLPRQRRLLLLHSLEALLRFLRQDLLQQDDGTEGSDATRRRRREICPVAMDPPSMVRVFAADESV